MTREENRSGMNLIKGAKLISPAEIKAMFSLSENTKKAIEQRRTKIKDIITGASSKILLIIGPCSADNEKSVMDYVLRLADIQEKVKEKILIVPRIYTNKPRTSGKGYKGLAYQPNPESKPDIYQGLLAVRRLHARVVEESNFACADEMLYPQDYCYIDDVLGYVAVGARSVENQEHRLVASGVEVPVGMKNATSGNARVMMNSIEAAQSPHDFAYRGFACQSPGNPYTHAILRGYSDEQGNYYSNYSGEHIERVSNLYKSRPELKNPAIIIDANHSNSKKNPLEQPHIVKHVLGYCKDVPAMKPLIKGFMVESYIEDGGQTVGNGVYGKSITDPCLGWEKTERLIYDMAEML